MRLSVPSSPKSYPSETMQETPSHQKPDCTTRKPFRVALDARDLQRAPFQHLLRDRSKCRKRETRPRVKPGVWRKQNPRKQPRTTPNRQRSNAYARDDPTDRHQTTSSKPSCRDAPPTTTERVRSRRLNPSRA